MTMPDWFIPMAATLTQRRFADPAWVYERKYDGIRLLAFKRGDAVELYSRNHLPQRLPPIAAAIARLPPRELILDGEVAWDGTTYHVFDLPWIDGRDLRALPLDARRAELAALPLAPPLARVDALDDAEPWTRACAEGWEGVVAKRRDAPYEHRRSPHWLKMKCEASQELVVGGFTDPQGKRVGLGALLVGYFDGDDLVFAGKVGTGFDTALLLDLRARLDALAQPAPPFTRGDGLPRSRVHWGGLGEKTSMFARIYRPAKPAMQSGKGKTTTWLLEFEPASARTPDPLMGWTSSGDMNGQITLTFETREQAVEYAQRHGIPFRVFEPKEPKTILKAYADNFAFGRKQPWTH